MNSMVII